MIKSKKQMFSTTPELDNKLNDIITQLNSHRITGEISRSKIIRIALLEWIDKQERALRILQERDNANKSAEEVLRENGYA